MENFEISFLSGKVISQQKHTQTHVYSEGGGGYVGPNGGRVKAPTIKSHNTTRHDLFMLVENGQEIAVSFPFDNIIIRDGHIITLVSAFRGATQNGYYVRLLNHNTATSYNVATQDAINHLINSEPSNKPVKLGCLGSLVVLVLGAVMASFDHTSWLSTFASFVVIASVVLLVGYQKYNGSKQALSGKLQGELGARIEAAIAQFAAENGLATTR